MSGFEGQGFGDLAAFKRTMGAGAGSTLQDPKLWEFSGKTTKLRAPRPVDKEHALSTWYRCLIVRRVIVDVR